MSNLLEQASLVMIPSGYKEDVVYSVIPTSGAGDLTFTRASNGTRIDSDGNVEVVPWNLAQYSEEFNNAVYVVKNAVTIVDNSTTAPNGTTTADLIYPNSSGDFRYVAQAFTQAENIYTLSVYAKAQNKNVIWMYIESSAATGIVYFDLSDGTMSVTAGSSSTPIGTMTAVGNGWYRCTYTVGASLLLVSGSGFGVCDAKGNVYATASGTNGVYFWGYQLNIGSTAKPYFPTTDRLNVPRLTYQNGGGGCPSLLLEKQSTNLITYSEDISNSFPTQSQVTITSNNTTSPDGTQNADLLKFDTTTAYILRNQTVNPLTTYTMSVFVKNNNFTSGQLLTFNMSDGVIGGLSAQINVVAKTATFNYAPSAYTSVSGKVEDYGNGWFRVSVTGTSVSGGAGWYEFAASGVTNSCFIWGWSLEVSSYATSYIPTTSSSATRVADACFKTGISSLIGQSQGTMFVDVDLTHSNVTAGNEYLMQLFEAAGERLILYRTSLNELSCYFLKGATTFFKVSTITTNGRHKLAFAYKSGDSAFYIDGVQIDINTTTFSAFSSLNELHIGANFNPTQAEIGAYNYNETIIFPTRLTNSELAQLTGNQNYTINQAYASYGVASESPNCVQP